MYNYSWNNLVKVIKNNLYTQLTLFKDNIDIDVTNISYSEYKISNF